LDLLRLTFSIHNPRGKKYYSWNIIDKTRPEWSKILSNMKFVIDCSVFWISARYTSHSGQHNEIDRLDLNKWGIQFYKNSKLGDYIERVTLF
jgi:hypothetical protein